MITILQRLIGGLGRGLITIGLLVLAFAAFQYWGTGLAESRAQEDLDSDFKAQLASLGNDVAADAGDDVDGDVPTPDASDAAEPEEAAAGGGTAPMIDLADIPEVGEAAGRIVIPTIGVDKTYVRGVGRDDLRKGPGHYPLTAFPGQPGNAAIAGHRTTYGAPFHDLDKLVPGDEIIVDTLQGRFTYIVNEHDPDGSGDPVGHFIVDPSATWVLDDHGDSRLTLTACHPKRSAAQRIVVTASLETAPAPAPVATNPVDPDPAGSHTGEPEPATGEDSTVDETLTDDDDGNGSIDEPLGWQPEHWPATAAWAVATALVAAAGWLLGRRWRPVPAYLVAAIPFVGSLFVCFTHLDKLLPAI